jgi:diaminopimelate epimerase
MMLVRNYLVEDKEIMVLDGTAGFMPGAGAIRLLADRHQGIGADRIIVFTGTEEIPSFRVYTADGVQQEMTAEDYRVLSRSHEDFELHVTEYFVGQLRQADAVSVSVAG